MGGIGRGQPLTGPTSAEDPFGAPGDGSPGGHVQLGELVAASISGFMVRGWSRHTAPQTTHPTL